MTLAPVNYLQRDVRALSDTNDDTGERWYPHPITGERFLSVTTALQAVAKAALVPWSGNQAAAEAMENLPRMVKAVRRKPCGETDLRTGEGGCGTCRTCVEVWVARRHHRESEAGKRRGSLIHDVIEQWALDDEHRIPDHLDEIHPWVQSFEQFVVEYRPDPFIAETTVISRSNGGWAGTLDLGVIIQSGATPKATELCSRYRLDAVRLMVDTKTTKKLENKLYPDMALQLGGGYCHAEKVMFRDGREFPMPEFDGAAILLLRPDKPHLRPVVCDETTHAGFLAAMALFRWLDEFGAAATQVKSFPLPEKPAAVKAAPRKRAARKTAPAVKPTNGARPAAVRDAVDPFRVHADDPHIPGAVLEDIDLPF